MTALTLYQSNDNPVSNLPVAKRDYATSNTTTVTAHITGVNSATATGYGEILSHGNSGGAWPALGALGAPAGHGLLLDDTSLEGMQILPGTWTTIVRLNSSNGTLGGDLYVVFHKWNSSTLVYTAIGQGVLTAQTLTTTTTNYTIVASGMPITSFGINEKVYRALWFNLKTNSQGVSNGTISWSGFGTTAGGGSSTQNTTTPGFQVSPAATFTGHGTLVASVQVQGAGNLSGHGVLLCSGQTQGKVTSAGHGALVGNGQAQGTMRFTGHGIILASGVTAAQAALSGHGTLTTSGQGQGNVRFTGHGALLGTRVIPPPTVPVTALVRDGTVTAVVRSGAVTARVRDGTITVKVR